jgi:hypothetical protein
MKWKCKEGHQWETTFKFIKKNSWCPDCSKIISGKKRKGNKNNKLTIQYCRDLAKQKKGECLSKEYKSKKKLLWKHRKFKEPTKGIGFRNMFRKNGFQVYLVDEFRTSCRCSNCEGGECSKFREIRNPKPAKNNSILSHGLLLCKKDCGLWNRDENSARNIYKIANNAINKKERP